MPTSAAAILLQSPAAAYRADMVGRDRAFGSHDDGWVALATLLEHAALLSVEIRDELLRDAVELAREILGDGEVQRRSLDEWEGRDRAPAEAIMLIADVAQYAGALHLAAAMLDGLAAADESLNEVQRGRVLALRGSVSWKLGDTDAALFCYRRLERMGRVGRHHELSLRAWIGYAAVAQIRGNYPRVERYCRRVARLAQAHGFRRMARNAQCGLMVVAGAAHRYDDALAHGWAAFQASAGRPAEEAEVLSNLGQVLLAAGEPRAARAAFASVVNVTLPARVLLPALGGLSVASASLGEPESVSWAVAQVQRIRAEAPGQYEVAQALFELAMAFTTLRDVERAGRCRSEALAIAEQHGYHEIALQAEQLATSAVDPDSVERKGPWGEPAADVARKVVWMEPAQLPEHVSVLAPA